MHTLTHLNHTLSLLQVQLNASCVRIVSSKQLQKFLLCMPHCYAQISFDKCFNVISILIRLDRYVYIVQAANHKRCAGYMSKMQLSMCACGKARQLVSFYCALIWFRSDFGYGIDLTHLDRYRHTVAHSHAFLVWCNIIAKNQNWQICNSVHRRCIWIYQFYCFCVQRVFISCEIEKL